MAKASGKTYKFASESEIDSTILETIDYKGGDQLIEYRTKEFSAVCPFSGLPDMAAVIVRYIPKTKLVELKSLKYYYISYRNVGIYQEKVTDRIFNDLKKTLVPKYLYVETVYNTRGGIDARCIMETKKGK